jgi:hypothetical protein
LSSSKTTSSSSSLSSVSVIFSQVLQPYLVYERKMQERKEMKEKQLTMD